ncbi:MAG: hypothetical protein QOF02_1058 [Blastocatellia bacterium]|jgi:hypothetical protein|nr:hypothetical protein [Blastocatellia bacterium]
MPSSRWLKAVPSKESSEGDTPTPTPNVSMRDVRRLAQEKAARKPETGQPVNQSPVNQSTSVVNQLTTTSQPSPLVNQLTSESLAYQQEQYYPSRKQRKLKGTRLPVNKIEKYELWCLLNKVDYQDAVEFALDWLTSQPVNQLTGQPANQLTTLINNINNELVINDEKANRVFAKYTELTGKPVTQKDQDAYSEISHLDYSIIVSGLETAIRRAGAAGSRVNSFRYANNCILDIGKLSAQVAASEPQVDYSGCPDCSGSGFYYPEGEGKGVAKCKHAHMGHITGTGVT